MSLRREVDGGDFGHGAFMLLGCLPNSPNRLLCHVSLPHHHPYFWLGVIIHNGTCTMRQWLHAGKSSELLANV